MNSMYSSTKLNYVPVECVSFVVWTRLQTHNRTEQCENRTSNRTDILLIYIFEAENFSLISNAIE